MDSSRCEANFFENQKKKRTNYRKIDVFPEKTVEFQDLCGEFLWESGEDSEDLQRKVEEIKESRWDSERNLGQNADKNDKKPEFVGFFAEREREKAKEQ